MSDQRTVEALQAAVNDLAQAGARWKRSAEKWESVAENYRKALVLSRQATRNYRKALEASKRAEGRLLAAVWVCAVLALAGFVVAVVT